MENPLSEKGFWRLAGAIRDRLCAGQTNRYREVQTQVQHLIADLTELDAVRRNSPSALREVGPPRPRAWPRRRCVSSETCITPARRQ